MLANIDLMPRKITHIVLSFFLLIASTGITFSMHYCGGKWVSVTINAEAESCCGGSCSGCENKNVHYEVEDDFVSPLVLEVQPLTELEVLFPVLFVFEFSNIAVVDEIHYADDSSPPLPVLHRLSVLQSFLC